jgi:hypothetical protein
VFVGKSDLLLFLRTRTSCSSSCEIVCSAELNINEVRNVFRHFILVAGDILSSANVILLVITSLSRMFRFLVFLGRLICYNFY